MTRDARQDSFDPPDAVEAALFAADAAEQSRGLSLADEAPLHGRRCAAVLAVTLFSAHDEVRARARTTLIARGPDEVRTKLAEAEKKFATLQDGAKLAKLAALFAPSVEARALAMAVLRVALARASLAPQWAGATIEGALFAALAVAQGDEAEIFGAIRGVERLDLAIKNTLPPGLDRLRGVKWLRISGAIKSKANIDALARLPDSIGLLLTGKDADLSVLLPAAEKIDGLGFHGNASKLSDVSILRQFTKLETLHLAGTGVRDLSAIAALSLVELSLPTVDSIDALGAMVSLQRLTAERQRCDLSSLSKLTNLTFVNVSFSSIASADWLAPLARLADVNLMGTGVRDLAPLAGKPLVHLTVDAPSTLSPLFDTSTLEELTLRGAVSQREIDELSKRNPKLRVTIQ